jgi:hypothetical protein
MASPDKCPNRRWNRDRLQEKVWEELRAFLLKPGVVIQGIESVKDNVSQPDYYKQELHDIEKALKSLDGEQLSLLQQAKRGFPENMIEADNRRINESRASLLQRKADLEDNIARASQAAENMANIDRFCELATRNIDTFTVEDKKLVVKALDLKVHVSPDRINIDGIIPIIDNIPADYVTSRFSESVKQNSFQ